VIILINNKHVDLSRALRQPDTVGRKYSCLTLNLMEHEVTTVIYSSARCVCHIHQPCSPCIPLTVHLKLPRMIR